MNIVIISIYFRKIAYASRKGKLSAPAPEVTVEDNEEEGDDEEEEEEVIRSVL